MLCEVALLIGLSLFEAGPDIFLDFFHSLLP